MPTINVSDTLYARLEKHAVGFATPESVIEMLLNEYEQVMTVGASAPIFTDDPTSPINHRILKIHDELFQFLQERKVVFMPRQKASDRLSKGYWFTGDDNYLSISFYTGGDTSNKTPNITFHVYLSDFYLNAIEKSNSSVPLCCIQLSNTPGSDGWEAKQSVISKIREELGNFECNRKTNGIEGRWNRYFEHLGHKSTDYLKCLEDFLITDKPLIDEIIRNANNPEIGFLDKSKSNRKINAIEKLRNQR